MFGFRSEIKIIFGIDDIGNCLSGLGYEISKMPSKEIFGAPLERIKVKKYSSSPTICFGNKAVTVLESIPLKREPTPMEILEWNYRRHLIAFSYSPEGMTAILKAHIPCSHGTPYESFSFFIDFWEKSISNFKETMQGNIRN